MGKATKKKGRSKTGKVRDLAVQSKAGRSVKGGDTKTTTPPKSTGKAIEITDYGFGVSMPVTTSRSD